MPITTDGVPVTAFEARAMRHADSICFDHQGEGFIRAIKRPENSDSGSEQTIKINVEASRIDNYSPVDGPFSCFATIMSAQYDANWQTVARRVRHGSRIAFRWVRDNRSPVTEEAGIVVDYLD